MSAVLLMCCLNKIRYGVGENHVIWLPSTSSEKVRMGSDLATASFQLWSYAQVYNHGARVITHFLSGN